MRRYRLILFLMMFPVSLAFANVAGDFKFTKTYENIEGAVFFDHGKHTELFAEECGFCHSSLKTFGGKVDELYGHKICLVCHESKDGPVECNQCHNVKKKAKK